MPSSASRYAEALADLSAVENALDRFQDELVSVTDIYKNQEELKRFLLEPGNETAAKKKVVAGIFEGKVSPHILNFLFLLLDKELISLLPDITREYIRMADILRNALLIKISSAFPLDHTEVDEICRKFKELYHYDKVKAETEIDPSLIGGVKVVVGDMIYDGSVKGRLAKLQDTMKA